jgi:hypothetical protein
MSVDLRLCHNTFVYCRRSRCLNGILAGLGNWSLGGLLCGVFIVSGYPHCDGYYATIWLFFQCSVGVLYGDIDDDYVGYGCSAEFYRLNINRWLLFPAYN